MFCNQTMMRNRRQAFAGADPETFLALTNALQLAQRSQGNQIARRKLPALHFRIHIRAAGDEHGIVAQIGQRFGRLLQRARLIVFEFGNLSIFRSSSLCSYNPNPISKFDNCGQ